ncbi:MAG: alanine racemase [Thermoleophilaceae bacterium]|nr:alanine racemase [Thermoleophilaceae bacterium]
MSAPERALARVDLGAVERNCAHLRSLLAEGAELCAVVKANGYGHGDVWCARAALRGGATWLAVATAAEALELRRHGIAARILVQGALTHAEERMALEAGADVVAWREGFVRGLAERAAANGAPARVHVKLDTGMGRLGTTDPAEARAVADLIAADARLELAGLMTHFATADELGDEHFALQLERFHAWVDETRAAHPGAIAHAANSAATFRDRGAHFDLVRCGIAIYGLDPFQRDPSERGLEPALSLESYVAAIKRFEPGQSAGYGRTWSASEPTDVGVVPIGYGDGFRRALSGDADVLVRGRRRPLRGTVSMDNLTIDLGSGGDVEEGDRAVLIGAQGGERILCEEVARRSETINYEVTCALTARVRRAHVEP